MKIRDIAAVVIPITLLCGTPLAAQTIQETKVDHDTSVKDGVTTDKTKVTKTTKHKTRKPKKVLGVKVGHKTVTHQTVRETSINSNGDQKTTVKSK